MMDRITEATSERRQLDEECQDYIKERTKLELDIKDLERNVREDSSLKVNCHTLLLHEVFVYLRIQQRERLCTYLTFVMWICNGVKIKLGVMKCLLEVSILVLVILCNRLSSGCFGFALVGDCLPSFPSALLMHGPSNSSFVLQLALGKDII